MAEKFLRGQVSDTRIMWAECGLSQVIIYRHPPSEDEGEPGDSIILQIKKSGGRPFGIDLCRYTHEELQMFRQVMNTAIDQALPISQQRDEYAAASFKEEGNATRFVRNFRPVPHLVDRTGIQPGDRQGLPQRSRSLDGLGRRPGIEGPDLPVPEAGVAEGSGGGPDEFDTVV